MHTTSTTTTTVIDVRDDRVQLADDIRQLAATTGARFRHPVELINMHLASLRGTDTPEVAALHELRAKVIAELAAA